MNIVAQKINLCLTVLYSEFFIRNVISIHINIGQQNIKNVSSEEIKGTFNFHDFVLKNIYIWWLNLVIYPY